MAPCTPPSAPSSTKAPGPAARHPPRGQHEAESQRPDQPDGAAKLPVAPFPPVDIAELRHAHAGILQPVFVGLLVGLEFGLPIGLGQRRHGAGDRRPFGDRQPRIRQPRQPSDHDHRHDHGERTMSQTRAKPRPRPCPALKAPGVAAAFCVSPTSSKMLRLPLIPTLPCFTQPDLAAPPARFKRHAKGSRPCPSSLSKYPRRWPCKRR